MNPIASLINGKVTITFVGKPWYINQSLVVTIPAKQKDFLNHRRGKKVSVTITTT